MRKIALLGLIVCGFACEDTKIISKGTLADEKQMFNVMIDRLVEDVGVANIFGHFYFEVELEVLKTVFAVADSTLSNAEIDSLCALYDYKCSTSIRALINEKNEGLIVYKYPEANISVLGYPIILNEKKAVSVNCHYIFIEQYSYAESIAAIVFEKKDEGWEASYSILISGLK